LTKFVFPACVLALCCTWFWLWVNIINSAEHVPSTSIAHRAHPNLPFNFAFIESSRSCFAASHCFMPQCPNRVCYMLYPCCCCAVFPLRRVRTLSMHVWWWFSLPCVFINQKKIPFVACRTSIFLHLAPSFPFEYCVIPLMVRMGVGV